MAIDRLLADARRLADAVDAGALLAVCQELPAPPRQQMVQPGGKAVFSAEGGFKSGRDGWETLNANQPSCYLVTLLSKTTHFAA